MNMHQVTPESIKRLRDSLRTYRSNLYKINVDEATDSQVIDEAVKIIEHEKKQMQVRYLRWVEGT